MRTLALLVALCCAGCPGLGQVAFDVDSSGQSTVQGSPLGGVLPKPPAFGNFGDLSFNQSQDFANQNTNKDHIDSARVSKLTLKVTSPANGSLSFLSSIEFDIQAPNLPLVRIAEAASIPAGASSVELTLDNVDIAPYAKADSFSITTKGTGTQPSQDTTIEADLTLHIVANVL